MTHSETAQSSYTFGRWSIRIRISRWRLATYAFRWRTYFPDVRILAMYIFCRRTWFGDVRVMVTYVLWWQHLRRWRTRIPSTQNREFGTTLSENKDSEYARWRTLWIPRFRSEKNASDSFFIRP